MSPGTRTQEIGLNRYGSKKLSSAILVPVEKKRGHRHEKIRSDASLAIS